MILDKIVVSTAKRVAHSKEFIAPEKMKQKAFSPFERHPIILE